LGGVNLLPKAAAGRPFLLWFIRRVAAICDRGLPELTLDSR